MYKNSEQYTDPTAGIAISNIIREEKRVNNLQWVYIASPYKGDVATNTARAKRYARFVARQCLVPVCPFYLTRFLSDDNADEREAGLFLGLQMLRKCNQLWVFGSVISEGMKQEIDFAKKYNIPIRYFNSECEEVQR